MFAQAFAQHQAGHLAEAERLYRQIIAIDARHADSLHLLGVLATQTGRPETGVDLIGRAIRVRKDVHFYHGNLANALRACGRLDDAATQYKRALALKPDYAEAHNNLGSLLKGQGKLDLAVTHLRRALALDANYADAHNNLGHALQLQGRSDEAIACYQRAIGLKPELAQAHANLGQALKAQGKLEQAAAAFERAAALAPDIAEVHGDLATVLKSLGRLDDAVAAYERAVTLKPDYAEAHNNLGSTLQDQGQLDRAVICYERALAAKPDLAQAHYNLGTVRKYEGRLDEAAACFEQAAARDPAHAPALCDLAAIRMAFGDFAGARELYTRAIVARPRDPLAPRFFLASLLYDPDLTADAVFAEHRRIGASLAPPPSATPLPFAVGRDPHRRLRVGWLSADVHDHPVMRNLLPIFEHRDRDRFEDVFYVEPAQPNPLQAALRRRAAGWCPTAGLSDAQVAERIRADGIDILMLLAGHFDRNRPQVAALRPAPVQVSIFDPATSGLAAMDYLVVDTVMTPGRPTEQFTERPLRLPNLYLHPRPTGGPDPAPPPVLAGGRITFGCFNNPTKLNDRVLELWARILDRVPNSRLVLRYFNQFQSPALRARVERIMAARGVDPSRLDLGGTHAPAEGHLAQYAKVDIALDPFPFTGSTTTFEALWMGVPVVSLIGHSVVSRWTFSMLSKVGLGDLAVATPDAYVDIAERLAAEPERLARLRAGLRATVARSLLCDAGRTTRHLERAQRAIWRRWCALS
jgi:predicted O-linked N-acetylglucosamine transferase (SPINDLY family)